MNITSSVPRFMLVGLGATFIHVSVAVGFIKAAHWHPGIANGAAFIAANLFSYAANTRWSFNTRANMGSWCRFIMDVVADRKLTHL